jgi:hypothetical protein
MTETLLKRPKFNNITGRQVLCAIVKILEDVIEPDKITLQAENFSQIVYHWKKFFPDSISLETLKGLKQKYIRL